MASTTATIKHRFQTAKANRTDVDVSATRWNDSEVMAGGSTGGLCVRDATQTDGWGLVDAVAAGQLLVSAGVGTLPTWSTSPTLSGHLLFSPDNTYDVGASGANRPRSGYFGTSVSVGSPAATISGIRLADNLFVGWWSTTSAGNYPTLKGQDGWLYCSLPAGYGFVPNADNSYLFGAPSVRWASGYFGTSVNIGTNPATTGAIRLAHLGGIYSNNAAGTVNLEILLPNDTALNIGDGANGTLTKVRAGAANLNINNSSQVYPGGDNTYSFGASALRWATGFFGTAILNSGYYEGTEMATPAAPAATKGRLYFDNSGGKTRLMVLFSSGAAQQIAIQP